MLHLHVWMKKTTVIRTKKRCKFSWSVGFGDQVVLFCLFGFLFVFFLYFYPLFFCLSNLERTHNSNLLLYYFSHARIFYSICIYFILQHIVLSVWSVLLCCSQISFKVGDVTNNCRSCSQWVESHSELTGGIPTCAHPLGGTACLAACWSSRTATSARLRQVSSWWPSPDCVCTPRSSDAWTAARRALWPAPPPPLPPLRERQHRANHLLQRPSKNKN